MTVSTKSAKSDKQYVWEGEADNSSFTVGEETDAEKMVPRGTVITLHLKVILRNHSFLTLFIGLDRRYARIIAGILNFEKRLVSWPGFTNRSFHSSLTHEFYEICRKTKSLSTQIPSELRALSRTIPNSSPSPSTPGRRSLVRKRYALHIYYV